MSTIAQTLSGAMGLLGAIVLFALQETSRSVERAAHALADVPHEGESALYLRFQRAIEQLFTVTARERGAAEQLISHCLDFCV